MSLVGKQQQSKRFPSGTPSVQYDVCFRVANQNALSYPQRLSRLYACLNNKKRDLVFIIDSFININYVQGIYKNTDAHQSRRSELAISGLPQSVGVYICYLQTILQ